MQLVRQLLASSELLLAPSLRDRKSCKGAWRSCRAALHPELSVVMSSSSCGKQGTEPFGLWHELYSFISS